MKRNLFFVILLTFSLLSFFSSCVSTGNQSKTLGELKTTALDNGALIVCSALSLSGCFQESSFQSAFPEISEDTCLEKIKNFPDIVINPANLQNLKNMDCLKTLQSLHFPKFYNG